MWMPAAAISASAWAGSFWPGRWKRRCAHHQDGVVEIGYYAVTPTEEGRDLFPDSLHVYHWHEEGFDLPEGASLLARGGNAFPNQAFRWRSSAYGFQFHPEVTANSARGWLKRLWQLPEPSRRPAARPSGGANVPPRLQLSITGWMDFSITGWRCHIWLECHRLDSAAPSPTKS